MSSFGFVAKLTAFAAAVSLTGCASPSVGDPVTPLGQAPLSSETLRGSYGRLASCAYQRLDKSAGTGIKKIDLPDLKQSRLALESGGVRYWELTFTEAGNDRTKVDFTVVQMMWGPDTLSTGKIMPEVRKCVS